MFFLLFFNRGFIFLHYDPFSSLAFLLLCFEKLNILSKSRYNVDLILVMYYISAGQTSLLQVQ